MCRNHNESVNADGTKLTFHRLPNGKAEDRQKLREVWLQMIRTVRPNFVDTNNTRVCSAHFEGGIVDRRSIPTILPSMDVMVSIFNLFKCVFIYQTFSFI